MSFDEGCSCRVWAIDGWVGDAQADQVNGDIVEIGTMLLQEGFNGTLNEKVAQFLPSRRSKTLDLPCIIYGEFEYVTDVTPTHMWLEYQNFIYDTIPGFPLVRLPATPTNRRGPGCVNGEYPENVIGSVNYTLSQAQLDIISGAVWVPYAAGKPGEHRYMP
jgi:hypothetical protein